jgi:hypothetical protein
MKMPLSLLGAAAGLLGLAALAAATARSLQGVGYDDTPVLPGQPWRVHDAARPNPPVVAPGRDGAPPSDAIVLFDGTDAAAWSGGPWDVRDGALVVNGKGTIETKEHFGDLQLHLEWAAPADVQSESQGRGNSGVFLMGRYEVQVLDSFDNTTYADGQAAAMYGQHPPAVNACREPGAWQTYDLVFEAPRFDGDALVAAARLTLFHNGVLVHHARPFLGATAHKQVATYAAHPAEGPIALQDHGNPVRFRNVWVRRL